MDPPIKLRMACADGQLYAVMFLLNKGTHDPFAADPYDGRTPLMVATHYNHPNVVAALLLHAQSHLPPNKVHEGLSMIDSGGQTVHEIAVKRDAVGCLSVLLYLHIQRTAFAGDAEQIRHLMELSVASNAHKVIDFLQRRYFPDESSTTKLSALQALKRTALFCQDECMGVDDEPLLSSVVRRLWTAVLSLAALFPKRTVFISMRITIVFSVLIAATSDAGNTFTTKILRMTLHAVGILSMIIMWFVYRKLCLLDPGTITTLEEKDTATANIVASESRKKYRSYEEALELLLSTSSIAGKSTEAVIQILSQIDSHNASTTQPLTSPLSSSSCLQRQRAGLPDTFTFNATDLCCHTCRIYRPMRSFHSKILNRCIPHSDHSCVFLESTVGRDNYPIFICALLLAVCVTLPLFVANSAVYLREHSLTRRLLW